MVQQGSKAAEYGTDINPLNRLVFDFASLCFLYIILAFLKLLQERHYKFALLHQAFSPALSLLRGLWLREGYK